MSLAHHGGESGVIEKLRQELDAAHRLCDQYQGQAKRQYPHGRVSADDDGELAFRIAADAEKQIVIVDFGKPVDWIGFPPQQAIELAQMLIRKARDISREPLTVVLH